MKNLVIFLFTGITLLSCNSTSKQKLPILGRHEYNETATGTDTVFHTIKDFQFVDQDSSYVTNDTFSDGIYIADFFFTSCPSICPLMKAQMLRVYDVFKDSSRVKILSHTIDPDYDNVKVLYDFASRLEVESSKWHFVTGDQAIIYDMAQTSYYTGVRQTGKAAGGYEHSGAFILVDNKRRIRGLYDGTDAESVDKLLLDINTLLDEVNE